MIVNVNKMLADHDIPEGANVAQLTELLPSLCNAEMEPNGHSSKALMSVDEEGSGNKRNAADPDGYETIFEGPPRLPRKPTTPQHPSQAGTSGSPSPRTKKARRATNAAQTTLENNIAPRCSSRTSQKLPKQGSLKSWRKKSQDISKRSKHRPLPTQTEGDAQAEATTGCPPQAPLRDKGQAGETKNMIQ